MVSADKNSQTLANAIDKLGEAFNAAVEACNELKRSLPQILAEKLPVQSPRGKGTPRKQTKKVIEEHIPSDEASDEEDDMTLKEAVAAKAKGLREAAAAAAAAAASSTAGKRKARDPNQPKRPPSAYILYQKVQRPIVRESLGEKGNDVKEVNKACHEKWDSLSEEEKKPFEEEAAKLRSEYEKNMVTFEANKEKEQEQGAETVPTENKEEHTAAETEKPEANDSSSSSPSSSQEESATAPAAPEKPESASAPATPRGKKSNESARERKRKHKKNAATANATPAASPAVGKNEPRDKKKRRKSEPHSNKTK
ncbi:HMG box protein [Schizosaccharomyces japonicus yFS275]|uniref:HMG box protein n=1 Tax=Schizosaccharomyces japonicus (strain yFS275 / FY16936) TaxID=402676 RepID=B6JYP7_SCHJY|nr:HMG box protein [Schizosaccharomyces japonicus yFS275]EEB06665.1 HMG box protein [Schizosaccharomyces japonicus yFS275]